MSSAPSLPDEDEMVRRYEPFIRHVAYSQRHLLCCELDRDDLLSVCRIGFLWAVRHWRPEFGVPLITYCWYKMRNDCLNARRGVRPLGYRAGAMATAPLPTVFSLDAILTNSNGHERDELSPAGLLAPEDVAEEVLRRVEGNRVRTFVASVLSAQPRLARVVALRYGLLDGRTFSQKEIAAEMGVSQMHVSRLEREALRWLRKAAVEQGLTDEPD